jgi:hypothetical protein
MSGYMHKPSREVESRRTSPGANIPGIPTFDAYGIGYRAALRLALHSTVHESVHGDGYNSRRTAPHYAGWSVPALAFGGSTLSLIMPGSRVRVPPLLSMSQSLITVVGSCRFEVWYRNWVQAAADNFAAIFCSSSFHERHIFSVAQWRRGKPTSSSLGHRCSAPYCAHTETTLFALRSALRG